MAIFNALLNLSELKELYSGNPVCVCPLYKGVINALKTFEAAGNPITIPEYKSLVKLTTSFSPKQAGTGDPSLANVRPISGWDSIKVTVSDKEEMHDYNITLPETIYGGTVDAVTGVGSKETLFLELAVADMDNDENYPGWRAVPNLSDVVGVGYDSVITGKHFIASNIAKSHLNSQNNGYFGANTSTTNNILFLYKSTFGLTQTQWKEQYPDLVLQLCLKRISPEPFKVTQISIPPLGSENTIFTNGEKMDIIYKKEYFWSDEA